MSKDPPRLDGGLIVRKGEAAPAVMSTTPAIVPASAPASSTPEATTARAPTPKGVAGTIAVTVRLDPERYERLKLHGVRQRQSNQEILVAALDAFLPSSEKG